MIESSNETTATRVVEREDPSASADPDSVPKAVQRSQLAKLRHLLFTLKRRALLSELVAALERMLVADQIVCRWVYSHGNRRLVLAANVNSRDACELLKPITHPVSYGLLRFFVHNLMFIRTLHGNETDLQWCGSDEFLSMAKSEIKARLSSTATDVEVREEQAMQAVAEATLLHFLGTRNCSRDGWMRIFVGGMSVGLKLVQAFDDVFAYSGVEQFRTEIVVVAFPEAATKTVHFLGWTTQEFFREAHTKVDRGGVTWYTLPHEKLFPMESLKQFAERVPAPNGPARLPAERRRVNKCNERT